MTDDALDPPRDRPALSLPRAAVPAIPGLFLWWGLAPIAAALALGVAGVLPGDPLGDHFLPLLLLITAPTLVTLFGLRWGRLWGIRTMRALALLAAGLIGAATLIGLAATLKLIGGGDTDAVTEGSFVLIVAAAAAPFGYLLRRALTRVRWLDPASVPAEWEPPMSRPRRR